jgi:hypothetical protein
MKVMFSAPSKPWNALKRLYQLLINTILMRQIGVKLLITQYNGDEDEALQGLPLAAQILYLRGIRPFMDYQTGIVGIKRKISLNGLCDYLHVDAHQGCKESRHSKDQVRRLLEWLIKVNLLERRSIERDSLIFFLKWADTQDSVQKKAATKPPQSRHLSATTDEATPFVALEEKAATKPPLGVIQKAATHQYIGISDIKLSKDSCQVDEIFEFWKTTLNHPRSILDAKRKKRIQESLKIGYSISDLKYAIVGCSKTPHNMGVNDQGQIYDSIELIFRDAGQIDRFIANSKKNRIQASKNETQPAVNEVW